QHAVGTDHPAKLAHEPSGVLEVLEDVAREDAVEEAAVEREIVQVEVDADRGLELAGDGDRARIDVDAVHVDFPRAPTAAEGPDAAADVEDRLRAFEQPVVPRGKARRNPAR